MAERRDRSVIEWLDINAESLSVADKLELIDELLDLVPIEELPKIRIRVERKRRERMDERETALAQKMLEEAKRSGVDVRSFVTKLGRQVRRDQDAAQPAQYQGPQGERWSGKGRTPNWLTKLEQEGHDREEYRVGGERH